MSDKWLAWKSVGQEEDKPSVDFTGRWVNPLGSEMDLKMTGSTVTGIYRTGVGAPTPAEEFDVVGVTNGDLISFVVSWGKYGSITAWVGQMTVESGKDILKTSWKLVKNVSDAAEPGSIWGAILTGDNEFYR